MRLISPTTAYNGYNLPSIYCDGIKYTLEKVNNINNIYNIFNFTSANRNCESQYYTNINLKISLDKSVKKLCRVEFYPGQAYKEATREYYPSFNGWNLCIKNKNQTVYELKNQNYTYKSDNKQKYWSYNTYCYYPQIINIPNLTFDYLNLECLGCNYPNGTNHNHDYQELAYLKFYQRTVDSYLLLSLSDNNLYTYNEDNTYTKILSLEEWNNKTKSEKKELLSKIQSPYAISEIDKNILNKFKIYR